MNLVSNDQIFWEAFQASKDLITLSTNSYPSELFKIADYFLNTPPPPSRLKYNIFRKAHNKNSSLAQYVMFLIALSAQLH